MYILGHTAFAYILIRPFYNYFDLRLEPKMVLLIFVFANLIDAIHFGAFRLAGHSIIGTVLFTAVWLIFFYYLKLIETHQVPILMAASFTHIVTDYWFSDYHFLFPLTEKGFVLFGFNSFEALLAGSIFGIIFILILLGTGDLGQLKKFIITQKMIFNEYCGIKNFYKSKFYFFFLFILIYLFIIGQFIIFLIMSYNYLLQFSWYRWLFMIIYLVWIFLMSSIFFSKKK